MAVAWIGNRETPLERAVTEAATLLSSSRFPVFIIDTDVDGTRAAVALAERVGGACDHVAGAALARETALITDKGGMFIAPGEVRRRADVVVVVGELPDAHCDFVTSLADTMPDLSTGRPRSFFLICEEGTRAPPLGGKRAVRLSCGSLAATLAALRAQCARRAAAAPVSHFDRFAEALASANLPAFLFSGHALDGLAMEMLQGLIADLNRTGRASALHLPASESGWGSTLAATWMTGFALRSGFGRGFPEFDPWRFDAARMIASGEADLRVWVGAQVDPLTGLPAAASPPGKPPLPRSTGERIRRPQAWHLSSPPQSGGEVASPKGETVRGHIENGTTAAHVDSPLIALSLTQRHIPAAAVTIAVGAPGADHDAVVYSARTGSLVAVAATQATELPSAATVLRAIAERIPAGTVLPC